jgi:hemolysin D
MTLMAPIAGTVQALTVTTVGQVVAAGQDVMRIVPGDGTLEVEVYLANKDIGFVKAGQEAIAKIESFPFSRYGAIDVRVTRIATDAIPEPDAAQLESNGARALNAGMFAGAQRTQNLVFPVTLELLATAIEADGARVPLSPGMAVSVEIKTGSRRILEYLFSPLTEVASEAMRER